MADYAHLKVAVLDKLLEDRGLTVDGKKADKVAALEASDAQTPEPEQESSSAAPEPDSKSGRVVKRATYVLLDGRSVFFDAGQEMPADVINACHVGDHIFQENS